MVQAVLVVVALIAVSTVAGLLWRRTTGRVVLGSGELVDLAALGLPPAASGATLLQLSTSRCATCRPTAALLERVAREHPGVEHQEVLLDERADGADLADRFGVLQTPTVLLLDPRGVIRHRIGGAPKAPEVREALSDLLHDRIDRRLEA